MTIKGAPPYTAAQESTGDTTEKNYIDITFSTDSSYISASGDITYSGGYGSSAQKITGTYSGTLGGYSNIYSSITATGAVTTSGPGVVNIKAVTVNTAALTDGYVYGGMFIAKHAHATNTMGASAALIGLEGWAYPAGAASVGTAIGGNFAIHNEATGAQIPGSVHRTIQVICDNKSGAQVPVESTGICIWNMAGAHDNAINIVNSGSGFTYIIKAADDGAPCKKISTGSTQTNNLVGWMKVLIGDQVGYVNVHSAAPQ